MFFLKSALRAQYPTTDEKHLHTGDQMNYVKISYRNYFAAAATHGAAHTPLTQQSLKSTDLCRGSQLNFFLEKCAARTLLYTFETVGSNPQSWPKSKNKPFHHMKKT